MYGRICGLKAPRVVTVKYGNELRRTWDQESRVDEVEQHFSKLKCLITFASQRLAKHVLGNEELLRRISYQRKVDDCSYQNFVVLE